MAPHLLEWNAWYVFAIAYTVWFWVLPGLLALAGPRHPPRPTEPVMKFTEAWYGISALFHIATVAALMIVYAVIIAAKLPA